MITIVIPLFNRASLIGRLLDSIAAQSVDDFKVIVVDNASTDASYAVAEAWIARYVGYIDFRIISESTPGAAAARNCGLRAVDTEITCFYDSDDTLRPDFVKTLIDTFIATRAHLVLYSREVHHIDGCRQIISPQKKNILPRHILHATLATQAYAARTYLFRDCGAWNPDALIWDDWELGIRLLKQPGIIVAHAGKQPIADVYLQHESLTGTDFGSRADKIDDVLTIAEEVVADDAYALALVEIVRARIAGRIRSEGHRHAAEAIRSKIKCRKPLQRLILSGVYHHTRLFRRGSATWAAPAMRLLCKLSR